MLRASRLLAYDRSLKTKKRSPVPLIQSPFCTENKRDLLPTKKSDRCYSVIKRYYRTAMQTTKQKIELLLKKLPDDCSLEDVQYHLYVLTKVITGLEIADSQGNVSQTQAEQELSKWLMQ